MEKTVSPLASAFHFTNEDLRANRRRRLSRWQRGYLWRRFIATGVGGFLLTMTPIVLSWLLVIWATGQSFSDTYSDQRALLGYLVGVLLGLVYAIANVKNLLLFVDLLSEQVREVQDGVQIWGRYLIVGTHRFVIDEEALAIIQPGLRYRVFLLPLSSTLLSIEFAE